MAEHLSELCAFAESLADESRRIILQYWRQDPEVADKADESPVTVADRTAEAAIRERIDARFPNHGIAGEEFGKVRLGAEYVWSIDPIDGTKAFISGSPLFGTLIALLHDGRPVLGLIDVPATSERWLGAEGLGAMHNGHQVRPRIGRALGQAVSGSTSPSMFTGQDAERLRRVHERIKLPVWGGDCYLYGLLSLGTIDLVIEAGLSDHDYLAPAALLQAGGGIVTDWKGAPLGLGTSDRVIAAGDPVLHAEVIRLLGNG